VRVRMSAVTRRDLKSPLKVVWRAVRTALVGLAFSLLICAAGLALWGWLIATASPFAKNWDPYDWVHDYGWRHNFPAGPAVSVLGVAAVLIGLSVYAWLRRSRVADHGVRALATLAVLYSAALSFGLPAFYHLVMGKYPVTPAVPLVVAAWLLALAGVVAVLVAMPLADLTRKAVPLVAVGVAVGVLAAVVSTVRAGGAGDDRRYVDATVAPTVDIPAAPTTFGHRVFSVKVSDQQANSGVQVAPAGAGFVVFHHGRVTGYGSDGKERWHYRRTGPGDVLVSGVRVFDEGRTVVAEVPAGPTGKDGLLIGLNAVTGAELWSRRWDPDIGGFDPGRNKHGIEDFEPSPFLITNRRPDKSAWTRIDTTTGKPMWTVDAPLGDHCWGRVADTQSQIATATVCSDGGKAKIGVVVQDPGSGRQIWQTTFSNALPGGPDSRVDVRATPAGLDGIAVDYGAVGGSSTLTYVNTASHTVLDLAPHDSVRASFQRADVFIVEHSHEATGGELSLYGADGLRRCSLPPGLAVGKNVTGDYAAYLALANEVVVYDGNHRTFQTFDKNTCAPGAITPAASADWMAAAPGALLVERIESDGTYVDGYA
jgi:outer membrane protein assembly factor BamB